MLAASGDRARWVLALGSGWATVLGPDMAAVETLEVPDVLPGGVLGAAWSDGGFVVIGMAAFADRDSPAYRLDPSTGTWTRLPGVPLAVNRPWNSSVVSTADGSVVVTGAWLAGNNAPARPTLGAAILPSGDDVWQRVDGGVLSPQAADAAPVGHRVVVVDHEGNAAWVSDGGWTRRVPTGAAAGECPPQLAVSRNTVLSIACHQGLLHDAASGTWQLIALPTTDDTSLDAAVGTNGGFLVPRVRLTVSDPEPLDLMMLDPAAAWPLMRGPDGMLATPAGWAVAEQRLTPNLADPIEQVTASTAPMPTGGDTCAQVPDAAVEVLGPGDALVSIQRRAGVHPPDGVPALGTLGELDDDWTDAAFLDCAANADELVAYWTETTWGGISLDLLVVHHSHTPRRVVDEAVAVANSFRTG